MRFSVARLFGVTSLSLLTLFGMSGCSGQQQEEEGMEVTDEDSDYFEQNSAEGSEGTEYSDNGYAEGSNSDYSDSEYSDSAYGDSEYSNQGSDLGEDSMAMESNSTESDLQQIIQEMNGQATDTGMAEATDAAALEQNLVEGTDTAAMATDTMMDGTAESTMTVPATDPMMAADAAAAESTMQPLPFQPGGTPAGPALPELGSKMPYIVQPGDTLARIAQAIYGDMGRWNEMASLTGMPNPSRIYPGDVVYYTLDDASIPFATAYESVQRAEEIVQPGDTLATISRRVYGSSNGWKSIWRQNDNIDNPDVLQPGTTVYYVQAGALSAELKKVKEEFKQIAQHKSDNLEHNIASVDATDADHNGNKNQTEQLTALAMGQVVYNNVINS